MFNSFTHTNTPTRRAGQQANNNYLQTIYFFTLTCLSLRFIIPPVKDLRKIIMDYVVDRVRPPNELIAVLSNDLYSATQLSCDCCELKEQVEMVQTYVPSEARGSIRNVELWIGNVI